MSHKKQNIILNMWLGFIFLCKKYFCIYTENDMGKYIGVLAGIVLSQSNVSLNCFFTVLHS